MITIKLQFAACFSMGVFLLVAVLDASLIGDVVSNRLEPYTGMSVQGVDATTLNAKVMCGYQGWFTAPGDGSQLGWSHYDRQGKFEPGSCCIDMWPDTTELDVSERFPSPFHNSDGSVASVFSSHNRQTLQRHFRWMKDYGIDGVFVQRFAVETFAAKNLQHANTVLMNCREAANLNGRVYAVMYDLTGLQDGQMQRVVDDWKMLVDQARIGNDQQDRAYLHHSGKPVVAVWGIGFNDGRKYTLAECENLLRFLKDDPHYGGWTVLVGVPMGWRTLDRDCTPDQQLHDAIRLADIVSPWTVGRYATPQAVRDHAEKDLKRDLQWCQSHGKDYLPVVFPGFSWHNLKPETPLNQIPRLKGQFLWSQYYEAKHAGCSMIYEAMFDEMNEGTAIFKCTNMPPVGDSPFVTLEGLPSDHYLWLTGMGTRLLRGETELTEEMPKR